MAAEFGWWTHVCHMSFLSLFCEFKIVRKMEVLKSRSKFSCVWILKYNNVPRGWNGAVWWLTCNPEDSLWVWSQPGSHNERNWSQDSKIVWVWKITNSISMKLPLYLPGSSVVPWTCLALPHFLSLLCVFMCMHICLKMYMYRGQRSIWGVFLNDSHLSFWDAVPCWA